MVYFTNIFFSYFCEGMEPLNHCDIKYKPAMMSWIITVCVCV